MHQSKNLAESPRFSTCVSSWGKEPGEVGLGSRADRECNLSSQQLRRNHLLSGQLGCPLLPSCLAQWPSASLLHLPGCGCEPMAHSRLFSLITGRDEAVAQHFKSILLRVKLSGTDSTNRKDPVLPGSSAAFSVEPWAAPASSPALPFRNLLQLPSLMVALIYPIHVCPFQSLPPAVGILWARICRNFTISMFI